MHKGLLESVRSDHIVLRHLSVCLAAAVLAGLFVLIQAELLAGLLSGRHTGPVWAALVGVVAARALLGWAQAAAAARTASAVKRGLRARLTAHLNRPGAAARSGERSGELVTLVGRGLDSLDAYLTGYLPAAAVAAVVPLAVLVRLTAADWTTALVVLVTLPLIPLFGALVGRHTKAVTERQLREMTRLGGHFLDVVRGLPTLRAFGRAPHQATVIARMAHGHRTATMRALRVAFLSSLVLELAASLSLALVAVPVGLRLLSGTLDLSTALLVLLLAPEAYLPLRQLGAQFHAAMEGVTAADAVFRILADPGEPRSAATDAGTGNTGGRLSVPAVTASPGIRLTGVTVRHGPDGPAALDDVSLEIAPGERVALVGESGAGKSTLLRLLMGFVSAERGTVRVEPAGLPLYVPQRPHLFAGSVAENIRLGAPDASEAEVRAAAHAAHADGFVARLPDGYRTLLGERGAELSAGQRQRVALARAFCAPSSGLVLLDEPTARLDAGTEGAVTSAARALTAGRTAVIVAHRPAMIALADRVVHLRDGRIVSDTRRRSTPGPAGRRQDGTEREAAPASEGAR
ncbi:thiol reductant ABC exporter subunit CydD [Streptomyces sp. GD-15H]|uniref:thiol reductant ABC exporter subunit CydD n=1 Tax=Streptomyces sp. GD-15H TaxID=3129112 RepID=UPI0032431DB5